MAEKKVPQSLTPSLYLNNNQITVLNDYAGAVEGIADALSVHDQVSGLGSALGCVYHRITDILEEIEGQELASLGGGQ